MSSLTSSVIHVDYYDTAWRQCSLALLLIYEFLVGQCYGGQVFETFLLMLPNLDASSVPLTLL